MPNSQRRWDLAPRAPPDHFGRFPDLSPITTQVLFNRGLRDSESVARFLGDTPDEADPFSLAGVDDAVARLQRAVCEAEPIVVYGDFDVDGLTATALLVQTLESFGGIVRPYIPHRIDEGYGVRASALTRLAEGGARLVLTADCGIRSVDEVTYANTIGLDVIVTDHHTVGPELPDAVAVVNPKRDDGRYGFSELAGVGVAYRVAQALLRGRGKPEDADDVDGPAEGDLLDLVALGTVADLAPLRDENRILVRRGLARLNRMDRPGIEALCQRARLKPGQIDAQAIGYGLGPRLNAAGRLGSAELAYELLVADTPKEATRLASQLDQLNRKRQRMTSDLVEGTQREAESQVVTSPFIFVTVPATEGESHLGIIGLVAGRLAERFYRPVVVVERGEEVSRASARSIPEFDITDALDICVDLLVRHGGHAAAAGFTAETGNLEHLADRLRGMAADRLSGIDLVPALDADAEIEVSQVSPELLGELDRLEPHGYGNPRPLFVSRRVRVLEARRVGREQKHLKLTFFAGGVSWDGIAFRQGDWAGRLPSHVDIAYHIELNEWRGVRRLQLNVQDIRPPAAQSPVPVIRTRPGELETLAD